MSHRPSQRDNRLDIFRGIALFIIFIAHTRGDWLWDWIPARFGFSDAADMFVFISGYAVALAFGGAFVRSGFLAGTARVAVRCSQLYLCHIVMLFGIAALAAQATVLTGTDYIGQLGVERLAADPVTAIREIFLLRYIPRYLDILPVYVAILALVPFAMLIAKISPRLVLAASVLLYAANYVFSLMPTADFGTGEGWLLNPFAWQLIFFTGFCFGRGWISFRARPASLTWLCVGFVIIAALIKQESELAPMLWLRGIVEPHFDKPNLDLLRYAHFLATAYLAMVILDRRRHLLDQLWAKPFLMLGRQGLVVFLTGIVLSHLAGITFDEIGLGPIQQVVVNAGAFALMLAAASLAAWLKSSPWRKPAATPAPVSDPMQVRVGAD